MSISKRNPLLRDSKDLDLVVGNLGDEMGEQQLNDVEGGTHSTPYCAAIGLSAISVCSAIRATKWAYGELTDDE